MTIRLFAVAAWRQALHFTGDERAAVGNQEAAPAHYLLPLRPHSPAAAPGLARSQRAQGPRARARRTLGRPLTEKDTHTQHAHPCKAGATGLSGTPGACSGDFV